MRIGGLQKLTLVDYPGKLAAVVFTAGCSFRCPWCHNPELVLSGEIEKHPSFSEKEVVKFLKERQGSLEGVVVTGGEPTVHEDLALFCNKVKEMGYAVKIDTNGSNPDLLRELVREKVVDYVAMDVKAPPEKYLKMIGFQELFLRSQAAKTDFWGKDLLLRIEDSVDYLKRAPIEVEFRTTLVPGLLDKEDVLKIAEWIAPASRFILQEYRPGKTLTPDFQTPEYQESYFIRILRAVEPFFEECKLRKA